MTKFLRQSIVAGIALFVITSFTPDTLLETGVSADFFGAEETDYIQEEDELLMTDGFFLLKENSVHEEEVSYVGVNEVVKYTVQSGETLSDIAGRHGVKTETLIYVNNLGSPDSLQVGQTLVIPPLDGVFHVVKSGETAESIAKAYKVEASVIKEHNKVAATLQKGQKLFVPGAKALPPPPSVAARNTGARSGRVNTYEAKPSTVVAHGDAPEGKFIWPTAGKLSRGFSGGHYGYDIANRGKPDVWAAGSGKVLSVDGGCPTRENGRFMNCNGGYGNVIVIDHGNGLQTRYAHLEKVYVEVGKQVQAGEVLGMMGNTGRSYGPTGIHLHFEVVNNGVRVIPSRFLAK